MYVYIYIQYTMTYICTIFSNFQKIFQTTLFMSDVYNLKKLNNYKYVLSTETFTFLLKHFSLNF